MDVACSLIDRDIDVVAQHAAEKKGVWGVPRNIARFSDWLTFDIMGDLVFGKAFGMMEDESNPVRHARHMLDYLLLDCN